MVLSSSWLFRVDRGFSAAGAEVFVDLIST
jgi:hypothetical protein